MYTYSKLAIISVFLIMFIEINLSYSQSYFDNNPVWKISSQCAVNDPTCISHNEYNYFIDGDSVINGHYYRKLFKHGYGFYTWNSSTPVPPYCTGAFLIGSQTVPFNYIRDTLGMIYINGNPEQCLYNFNLNVGDTLPICFGNSDQSVISIDSLLISGNYRKVFHLSGIGGQSQEIIEGVGHTYGFIELLPPILECANVLECYSVNDTSYYPASGLSCLSTSSLSEISEKDFSVFPTPTSDFIIIGSKVGRINSVRLIDSIGNLIFKSDVVNAEFEYKLFLPKIANGYYFLSIYSNIFVITKPVIILH